MKKIVMIILSLCLVLSVFAACSKKDANEDHGNVSESSVSESVITTDAAVITEANAINYIKSYSAEELGLSAEDYESCSFMVNSAGKEIEGDYYIMVIATVKNAHTNEDGTESFTFDNKGEYFIRYDAKQVLRRVMDSEEDKYEEMTVKEVPSEVATEAASEAVSE